MAVWVQQAGFNMQQVFNFQQLGNSLAGLFDGSNQAKGKIMSAQAEYEAQRARELKRQNDMLDANARDEISAQLAFGGDTVKIRQALQDLPVPKMIQPQEQNPLGGLFKSGAGYAVAPSQTDLGRGESAEMGQQYMNSRYTMSAEDQNAFKRAMQNVIMHAAMGGNGRTMGQNQLDFEKQDRFAGLQNMAMGAVDQSTRNAIMSLADGKTYDPYAANGDGLMYNKATGQVDASNPYTQAKIGEIGARANLIGAQTQGEYLNHGKTQAETQNIQQGMVNTGDKLEESIFTAYDPANNQKFIDQSKVGKASIIRSMTGVTMNQAGQILSAYPNPEAVKAAVANGYVSREIANAIFEANGW